MKAKIIVSIFFLLFASALRAAGTLPQGLWTVESVTVEKNTDGNLQTAVYNSAGDVENYIPCPQEWEINEKTIILTYSGGREKTVEYGIKGGLLIMEIAGAIQSYKYDVKGENLILAVSYEYVNNLPSGHTERIEEKRIITLRKNK